MLPDRVFHDRGGGNPATPPRSSQSRSEPCDRAPGASRLAGRAVFRKTTSPFFVHAPKVILVGEDDGGADGLVERRPGGLQNGRDIPQRL